jgi:hypothetical protein
LNPTSKSEHAAKTETGHDAAKSVTEAESHSESLAIQCDYGIGPPSGIHPTIQTVYDLARQ